MTALHIACRSRQSSIVGLLLQHVARPASSRDMVASSCVTSGDCGKEHQALHDSLRFLINLKDNSGRTALHHAFRSGRSESVSLLLQAGADPYITGHKNRTALIACAEFEQEEQLWSRDGDDSGIPYQRHAAGLRLHDVHRPLDIPLGYSKDSDAMAKVRAAERRGGGPSVGIDRIVGLLLAYGDENETKARYSNQILYDGCSRAATFSEEYTATVFKSLVTRLGVDKSSSHAPSTFAEAVLQHRDNAVKDAVHASNLAHPDEASDQAFSVLLRLRQYDLIEALHQQGANFAESASHHGGHLHTLVRYGMGSLLSKVCSPLYIAACHNSEQSKPIQFGIKPMPLLLEACEREQPNLPVFEVLIQHMRAEVDVRSRCHIWDDGFKWVFSESALHILAKSQYWWQVEQASPYHLGAGADIDIRNEKSETPLHVVIGGRSGNQGYYHRAAVRTLVEAGADVNEIDGEGGSCLARVNNDLEMVKLLIKSGATIGPDAIFAAVGTRNLGLLEVYHSQGGDPNQRQPATRSRIIGPSRAQRGSHIDDDQWYPLYYAMGYNRGMPANIIEHRRTALPIIRSLLRHGANPLATFEYRIDKRAPQGTEIESAEDANPYDDDPVLVSEYTQKTIFHYVIEEGEIIDPILLEYPGLNVEHCDPQGRTLLHAACLNHFGPDAHIDSPLIQSHEQEPILDSPSILQAVLNLGADLMAVDNDGKNVLHHLADRGLACTKSAAILLTRCPELLLQVDSKGNTPLHAALQQSRVPLVQQMLQADTIEPLRPDSDGNSALHHFAGHLFIESPEDDAGTHATQKLICKFKELGVDINARNDIGDTPLHSLARNAEFPSTYSGSWGNRSDHSAATILDPNEGFQFLLSQGADPFVRNHAGETILHLMAARPILTRYSLFTRENVDKKVSRLFKSLVKLGLDPMDEDGRQRSSLDVAAACQNEGVLRLFEREAEV